MTAEKYSELLLDQFALLNVPADEVEYRRKALLNALKSSSTNHISVRYYNLAHELKCLHFLSKYGNVEPALDYSHKAGCDAKLNDHYQIEFVCTSQGSNINQSGYDSLNIQSAQGFIVCDYSAKERFLYSRITSVIKAKRDFYENHIATNSISSDQPYLIFIGLGELAHDMFCGDCGIELTGVLLGKGCPYVSFDSKGNVVHHGYTHNESFLKKTKEKTVDIDCNIFCRENYRCVSGIIFTKAKLFEEYTTSNTWLFVNPYANVKISKKDFPGMIYWTAKNDVYIPMRNGRRII